MKIFIVVLVFVFNLIGCASSEAQQNRLDVINFDKKLTELTNEQLIDVRTPQEFEQGHLINAVNINFNSADFSTQLKRLDKSKPVMIYCAAGGRSARALQVFIEQKFSAVYELKVGYNGWLSAGKPTQK